MIGSQTVQLQLTLQINDNDNDNRYFYSACPDLF